MMTGTKGQKHTPVFPKVKSVKTKMAKVTPKKDDLEEDRHKLNIKVRGVKSLYFYLN